MVMGTSYYVHWIGPNSESLNVKPSTLIVTNTCDICQNKIGEQTVGTNSTNRAPL